MDGNASALELPSWGIWTDYFELPGILAEFAWISADTAKTGPAGGAWLGVLFN